jgi:8-oxo-dGTP pyrophosphatase MutT (NUDIX family)
MGKKAQPVICIIVENLSDYGQYELLLQKRVKDVNEKYYGFWEIPQGRIEAYEDFQSSIQRELYEETGLNLEQIVVPSEHFQVEYEAAKLNLIVPLCCVFDSTNNYIGIAVVVKASGVCRNTQEATSHQMFSVSQLKDILLNDTVFPLDYPILQRYVEWRS